MIRGLISTRLTHIHRVSIIFHIPFILPLESGAGYLLDFDDSGRAPAQHWQLWQRIISSLLSIMIQYTAEVLITHTLPEHAKDISFNGVCPVGEILQVDKVTYNNL